MTLKPRSLFGRNLLLIGLLMVVSQLASAWLVRELLLLPRLDQIADGLARNIGAVRAGLGALPPAQREVFLAGFDRGGAAATPAAPADDAAPAAPRGRLTRAERYLMQALSERVAADATSLAWQREDGATLTAQVRLDGQLYSLRMPGVLTARDFNSAWLAAIGTVAALALLGAWAIQRHLNRPLARVVHAAGELAQGHEAPTLAEDGPLETATLARSFNQLGASLARADRERALMLAGVSHDLRTPLAKLRLGVEILSDLAEAEVLASMTRSIEEMDAIVGQFLDFARAESAEPWAEGDVDSLVQRVAQACADHGEPLLLALGGPPPVAMRERALHRALTNLVENALRHGRAPVGVGTGADAKGVWIEVTDEGAGIDAAEADALKQPFRRAQAARAGVPGAGLGLAIVERIVRSHGGRFDLLANQPEGLRARIWLPLRGFS